MPSAGQENSVTGTLTHVKKLDLWHGPVLPCCSGLAVMEEEANS